MTSGKFTYKRCRLCGAYEHPDETVRLPASVPGGTASGRIKFGPLLCWSCIEALRRELPDQRPLDLKLLEGRGQGELFRQVINRKLRPVEDAHDPTQGRALSREVSRMRAREARERNRRG